MKKSGKLKTETRVAIKRITHTVREMKPKNVKVYVRHLEITLLKVRSCQTLTIFISIQFLYKMLGAGTL